MTEDMMWFWAVLVFTVPPVLRFRENFLVPGLAMLLTFGFFTEGYWLPDFYNIADWPRIVGVCVAILVFYYVSGFMVHFLWFKSKSRNLRDAGAFSPLLKAWIKDKAYVVNDDFVAEIRRLRMFEVTWDEIKSTNNEGDELVIRDDVQREPEILSEIRISKSEPDYVKIKATLIKKGIQ